MSVIGSREHAATNRCDAQPAYLAALHIAIYLYKKGLALDPRLTILTTEGNEAVIDQVPDGGPPASTAGPP